MIKLSITISAIDCFTSLLGIPILNDESSFIPFIQKYPAWYRIGKSPKFLESMLSSVGERLSFDILC